MLVSVIDELLHCCWSSPDSNSDGNRTEVCVLNSFLARLDFFQYLQNFAFRIDGNRCHLMLIFLLVFLACFICMFV